MSHFPEADVGFSRLSSDRHPGGPHVETNRRGYAGRRPDRDPPRVYGAIARGARGHGSQEEPLHYTSLQEIGRRIATREVSPVQLTQQILDRIATIDQRLKSYAVVLTDRALDASRVAEREIYGGRYRGPLHGVRLAVKDVCYTKVSRQGAGRWCDVTSYRMVTPL
jgi:hypothetical protein